MCAAATLSALKRGLSFSGTYGTTEVVPFPKPVESNRRDVLFDAGWIVGLSFHNRV